MCVGLDRTFHPYAKYKKVVALALINAFFAVGQHFGELRLAQEMGSKVLAEQHDQCVDVRCVHRAGFGSQDDVDRENRVLDELKAELLGGRSGDIAEDEGRRAIRSRDSIAMDAESKKQQTRIAMAKSSFRYML